MGTEIFDLNGKTALITGASRGLGQAIATGLAEAGARVLVTSRNIDGLEETVSKIKTFGGEVIPIALDVENVTEMKKRLESMEATCGNVSILVNNAGYEQVCSSVDLDEVLWDKINNVNLKGAFFCAQHMARSMIKFGAGSIINVCSLTSYVGVPTAVPYGSSKSGMLGMTRALAAEWAPHGVRVNGIAPGYFRTELTDAFYQNDEWQKAMLGKIPLGSFGDANDLKGATVFLAGDASRYVTGQCLAIDGGYLASI